MGCFSSQNLSVAIDKKESINNKPLNKTEIQNETIDEHSCRVIKDINRVDKFNINNIPFDVIKSYKYYFINKNYKSCEVKEEEKQNKKEKKKNNFKIININDNNNKRNNTNNKDLKGDKNYINKIEDMDVDINLYKKYIIKDNNKKKEEIKESNEEIKESNIEKKNISQEGNNNTGNNKSIILRKSVEERIIKYNIIKDQEKNKEFDDSLCNLGQSYIK